MGDESEGETHVNEFKDEKKFEDEITKEISKLKYFLEEADELIQNKDYAKMDILDKRAGKIITKLTDTIAQVEELKLDHGSTPRTVRQWKKEVKSKYLSLIQEKEKLSREIKGRQEDLERESERRQTELAEKRQQQHEFRMGELRERQEEHERKLWEEKLEAELRMTQQRMEIEKSARATTAKLPKLKITPFKGTPTDWVRFENIFLTQVHEKPITDEEKFGYLLEMVCQKVRDKIANLKPGEIGYKTAWDRLKKEYGQTKLVVNAHIDEIVNLPVVKGYSYTKDLCRNYDALLTLGEAAMLKGFVMTTVNKLPQVKPDLVRMDENWENWDMAGLIDEIRKWLSRHTVDQGEIRKEGTWFTPKDGATERNSGKTPLCIFCKKDHWGGDCKTVVTAEARKKHFVDNQLCFNCGRPGHRANKCHSRGCVKCRGRHHTSLCDQGNNNPIFTGYTSPVEGQTLPPMVPVNIKGTALWAYLDSGSSRNFISKDAIRKLKLIPVRHETRQMVTLSGTTKQSLPIFEVTMTSLDGKTSEKVELTGSKMSDFTTVRRPNLSDLKSKYGHASDKSFYMKRGDDYQMNIILGDSTYSRIKTEEVFKGEPGDPIVEGTTFGWTIHGGEFQGDGCWFSREVHECQQLYNLDVLGVEDRGENDQLDVDREFRENIVRDENGRYEVKVPWIPGTQLSETNEVQSRLRLKRVEKKLELDEKLKKDYEKIIVDQVASGVIEKAPSSPTGERVFYMPHKPVVKRDATTTKTRMVFDASAKPQLTSSSINECMYPGPSLQPLIWDILVRARMSPYLLVGDIEKAFLQIGLSKEDRDAFRFLFNINGKEEQFRFARVPFGAEASPFMLGATLQHHYDQQSDTVKETVSTLQENTYVDNLMVTGSRIEELQKFKLEATEVLEGGKFPVHKWESNVSHLESANMPNPGKLLGHVWNKTDNTLKVQAQSSEDGKLTKKTILSRLGRVFDPLGIISPTMVEGKRIYRDSCEEEKSWNAEVSLALTKQWNNWTKQLRDIEIPRSVMPAGTTKAVELHLFADASALACSTVAIAAVEQDSGKTKGLLVSKSRLSKRNTSIPRLELVSGHMGANLARNLTRALKRLPIRLVVIWMDSLVSLYWILNPGKPWKTFVSNRVKKLAEITEEVAIQWKYCPTERNLADLGSRGASLNKMERSGWYAGPEWLMEEEMWPEQPNLKSTPDAQLEEKPIREIVSFVAERQYDEFDDLLLRKTYWSTIRITGWILRFVYNLRAAKNRARKRRGPLTTDEVTEAQNCWIRREQRYVPHSLEQPGWFLTEDAATKILRCQGRIPNYAPVYLEDGLFVQKLIRYVHEKVMHLGIASTMAEIRRNWWIPRLRSLVKKHIRDCNVCKVFATKPLKPSTTSSLPSYRLEAVRPFQQTGVDFAGPLVYKKKDKSEGKGYVIIFTCAVARAVHLEVTKSQSAEEFQRKLNSFITRKTRPELIVSDNAAVFKTTANWIRKIRKSEQLQNHLATQEIRWKFNLAKSPWWGGMYERLIRELKKTLYKTLGKTHLFFVGDEEVLTPSLIMWGQQSHTLEDIEVDDEEFTKFGRRLVKAKNTRGLDYERNIFMD